MLFKLKKFFSRLDFRVGYKFVWIPFMIIDFRLACEAEAKHMYCFSGVVVVGGVNFLGFTSFSPKL